MARKSPTYLIILNAVIFLILEVAALCMVNQNGTLQKIWMSRVGHNVMTALWGSGENFKYFLSLKEVNKDLSEENIELRKELEACREQLSLYQESTVSDSLDQGSIYKYIPASVIKLSRNKQHNYFLINKGKEDSVLVDDGVISKNGVIGIISSVGKKYSFGLSFMNTEIKISSRIGYEGAIGWMSWDGKSSDKAILHDIPCNASFEIGDTILTSGYSQIFPPDIPLGTIENSRLYKGSVYEMEIKLFEDFNRIRFVSVVNNKNSEEIKQIEHNE